MINLKQILFFLIIVIPFLASCKKGNDAEHDPAPAKTETSYLPLKVGNYWIYRQFNMNAAGIATATNKLDSCYIAKDTIINDLTYFKLVRPVYYLLQPENLFVRDSLHYLVNHKGKILFSSQDFASTFSTDYIVAHMNDTVVKVTTHMTEKDLTVASPAGVFVTSNFQHVYDHYPRWQEVSKIRYLNTRFAKGVGIVTETQPFYVSDPNYIEWRLERYQVQ